MVKANSETKLADMVSQIIAGNSRAEEELVTRYKAGISIIIGRIVHSQDVTGDVSQDTFKTAIEKIRRGDVRDPERLSGFICGIARNLAVDHVRKQKRQAMQEDVATAEAITDPAPNQLESLCQEESARVVRQVINELKLQRDREVISRYFIAEEDKDQVCAALGLTRLQFNNVISRALQRFKELYIKQVGEP